MADHELKTWPDYFEMVKAGEKHFEVRRYDRNFQPGQTLLLREWDPGSKEYTGRQVERRISFMRTAGSMIGIEKGYCILGLDSMAYLVSVTGKPVEIFSTLDKAKEYAAVSPPAEIRITEYTIDHPGGENGKTVEHAFID